MALPSSRSHSFLPSVGLALAASLAAQKALPVVSPTGAQNPAVAAAFAQFQRDHGDGWQVRWHPATGTPMALYGPGLPLADWRENSLPEARRHALRVLQEQAGLLGLGYSEFRESQGCRIGRQWAFVFDQFFGTLPVLGGRADVRVSMAGRVAMFGSTAVPVPADFVTMPAIGAELAAATAWQSLGVPLPRAAVQGQSAAPRLVVWSDLGAAPVAVRLAWEVVCRGLDASGREREGRVYVDAQSAAVLQFRNDRHECGLAGCHGGSPAPTSVAGAPAAIGVPISSTTPAVPLLTSITVFGWVNAAVSIGAPSFLLPMPGLTFQVPGVGPVTTNAIGQATFDLAAPVQVVYQGLAGRHHLSILGGNAPSGSFNLTPGQPTVVTLLAPLSSDRELAHTNVSYWTDRGNEFCRSVLGNTPELNRADQIGATVNLASICTAVYHPSTNSMEYQEAAGTCRNTAQSTVIVHEWGHGLDHQYGGISFQQGLSEGWADVVAMYTTDTPVIGDGIAGPGSYYRTALNTRQFPSGNGAHEQGETWMGFAWKLRERLATTLNDRPTAIVVTNDIVLGTLPANAQDQVATVLEVFLADDNDGILSNGTPHYADLAYACQQHSLPFPVQGPPANDECAQAITVQNGSNGPFTNVFANTSAQPWNCPLVGSDVWFRYTGGGPGTLTVSTCGQADFDTVIEVYAGSCGALQSLGCADDSCALLTTLSVQVPAGAVYIRVGGYGGNTGNFTLDVNGPPFVSRSVTTLGTGCYRLSPAFYEEFPTGTFDLNGWSMRIAPDAFGQQEVTAAGFFVWPSPAAVALPLGDETDAPLNLPTPFPYPGGSTSQLVVCSNGYVSVGYGNGVGNQVAGANWLQAQRWIWGTWHDFDPSAGGSVRAESIGNVTYITWLDVPTKNFADFNIWQLQFDRQTGSVTWAWVHLSGIGDYLVGSNRGLGSQNLGSFDLTALLPGGFRVGTDNYQPMVLSGTAPTFGGTATFTTTAIPATASVLLQVVGLTPHAQGLDLSSFGMPGCRQYASADAVFILLPSGGQAVYSIGIPNDLGLQGLPLVAQTLAFAPGLNAVGVLASNGVHAVVGH